MVPINHYWVIRNKFLTEKMVLFLKTVSLMKGKDVRMLSVGDWESCLVCDTGLDGSGAAGWLTPPTQ